MSKTTTPKLTEEQKRILVDGPTGEVEIGIPVMNGLTNKLTDEHWNEIERLTLASLEELVFGKHMVEDGDNESAQDCFTTVGSNVDRIQEIITQMQKERGEL